MLDYSKSFIETQFPVSKISKESYKERKAGASQTLTGLGKWWGRKPLILVRATVLGVLMPVSENPARDREIFLKILSMDEEGLLLRKNKNLSTKDLYLNLNQYEREKFFDEESTEKNATLKNTLSAEDKQYLQKMVFNRLSYDDKLKYCGRPENVEIIDENEWKQINSHLNTHASNIQELIRELGENRFGHIPTIGDCFAGGGSIPFESARLGANVFASDLNPISVMLTWASINIIGSNEDNIEMLKKFIGKVYTKVSEELDDRGIEINSNGDKVDSYLYCNETVCPDCGYKVPLAPSWIIGRKSKTIALLQENDENGFDIKIIEHATAKQIKDAESLITIRRNAMWCPHCQKETPVSSLRGNKNGSNNNNLSGLRDWEKNDFMPLEDDVYQERLYALRCKSSSNRYYIAPSEFELNIEKKIEQYLGKVFSEWQEKGYIPSNSIETGYNTDQPIREKGWKYWHQLFNPRQLYVNGLFAKTVDEISQNESEALVGMLNINNNANWNSKLCRWRNDETHPNSDTFYNQALNTLFTYCCRSFSGYSAINLSSKLMDVENANIVTSDARKISSECDIWITDPPYADAVNYHELTEFFLAWDEQMLKKNFENWSTDSKRVLAVRGTGQSFNDSMIEVYSNLRANMPDNGYQVVMFTHQDVKVWSELAMILWSAGLQVVSAWNIVTETEAIGIKKGNYVKGTVLLTLTKQTSNEIAFQDELYDEIKYEVTHIIDSMRDLDDKDDPDFTDADYLLASYASSLKVLTKYKEIEGIDVQYWLSQSRDSTEINPVEALINKAVRIAYDYLIPDGFEKGHWVDLKPEERFFVRGLELEMNGLHKISSYQELARGFGVNDYTYMFAEFRANSARLKTPSEYRMAQLGGSGFGGTLLRHLFVAIYETTNSQSTQEGRTFLKDAYKENNQYWYLKPLMIELLSFIANLEFVSQMEHWHDHAHSAKLLKEALRNEGV